MKNILEKINKAKSLLFIAILITVVSACDDRWLEMNTDPNKLSTLPDEYLFTNAVRGTFKANYDRFDIDFGGQFGHIWVSNNWNREPDKYNDINSQGDISERVYTGVFNGPIRNINEVRQLTGPGGSYENPVRFAQANIIAVVNFSRLADMFGDIPYFEGGMGKYDILKPKYDGQEEIYADMVETLKEAVWVLKTADSSEAYPEGTDPVFDGDINKWLRFANSFRLRLAMHARFADAAKYEAVIAECLQEDLIETNEQNVTITCWDSENGDLYNPWNNYYIDIISSTFTLNWSEKFINTLKATNDPRLPFFASTNNSGEYVGMPNGLIDEEYAKWSRSNSSLPTAEFLAKDQPMYLMSASEIWLLRAEAALFDLGSGDPNTMYQAGIQKAMEQWSINSTAIADYLANETEATLYGDTENQFRQIATQLWISFVPNAFESWTTIRRTGYPLIPKRTEPTLSKGITDGIMPTRIKYPYTVERSVNGANLDQAIANMGGDEIDLKLWWDRR